VPSRPRFRTSPLRLGACALAATLLIAALAACRGEESDDVVVAEVGDTEISAEQVAEYMAGSGYGVNVEDVRKAVEELIHLHLVKLRARERHSLTPRESLQIREWGDMLLINQFREDVIWSEVEVDDAQLREWYDENVSEEARVRHILIAVPPTAGEEERRAARQKADSLHAAIAAGADFGTLAREHSVDPASKEQGGLMRWFRKGEMVEPFEKASFEGRVGELYPDVVETQFGHHIIRIEERRKPSFEDLREEIEEQLAAPRRTETESAYVTRLMETSGVEFLEGNIDRFIALLDAQPAREPTAEERALPLATFRAGEIQFGELYDLYANLPSGNQRAIESLDQTQMIQALAAIMQQRLLLAEARSEKVALDSTRQRQLDERVDALYVEAYLQDAGRSQLEVPDSMVRRYYDEHREFYRDRTYDEVREQIRQVLMNERMETLGDMEGQRRMIAAIADSQASRAEVERHEDRYEKVLELLREKYEEMGRDPDAIEASGPGAAPTDARGR
jgi:parvulin-like peptidyl-prolyl isomerase